MVRTQVYLTTQEKNWLDSVAKKTGSSQSELIRKAIDKFIGGYGGEEKKLMAAFGIWKGYNFDYMEIRKESDRDFS